MEPDLSVQIDKIYMKNPITTASGTYGQGENFRDFYDINILGALTTKTITLNKKDGNPPPRIAETKHGYLNSIGLQNSGVEAFIEKYNHYFDKLNIPIIVSIAGKTYEEYSLIAEKISDNLNIQALEINISCPNVQKGGLQFACDPIEASKVVKAVRSKTNLPIITKLTPNTDNNIEIAKACVNEGTNAISLINTLKGMAININTRKPLLKNIIGGYSGPSIKPVAVRMTYELANNIDVPIIGMGGVSSYEDVLEFIIAGAHAVAVGTLNLYNPVSIPIILEDLKKWLIKNNINKISELRKTLIIS